MSARRRACLALAAIVAIVASATVAACGHPPRRLVIPTGAPSAYPGVLPDPITLRGDFMVRQALVIRSQRDGKPVEAELDAVLQKQGETLLIVGLGPMSTKAFTLTQRAGVIEFEQLAGPALPFSPRNIVLDVHRVYFKRLPPPTAAGYTGVQRGELDGEHVEETWREGQLRAIDFTRPGSAHVGAVHIELGAGCDPVRCEPESATLRNDWFGYSLSITNESHERL